MMKIFSIRTSEEVMKEVDKLAKLEKVDRSLVFREALEKGLEKIKLEVAIKLFAEGKITIGESAEIAGISVGEMMEKFRERGIESRIKKEELKTSLQEALKILR